MIFRNSLLSHLDREERVEADDGYLGEAPEFVKCPASFTNPEETLFMQQQVQNRLESVNKRFKNWGALKQVYRYQFDRYGEVFVQLLLSPSLQSKEVSHSLNVDTVIHLTKQEGRF